MFKKKSYDSSVLAYEIELILREEEDDGSTYSPKYYFKHKGNDYSCDSKTSSSFVNKDKKLVYFDSNNPSDCLTEFDASSNIWGVAIILLLPGTFITIGIVGILKIRKNLKNYDHLETKGVLYRNLPYRMEESNMMVNNRKLMRIVVDFAMPNGSIVIIKGEPRYDLKNNYDDGLVDVLIDLNDTSKYFIDFNIEEK